jgi:hypothetical protein
MLLLLLVAAHAFENDTRFVHRHACFGDSHNETYDTIGCAEREATLFEHTLTPAMLWCNTTHCKSRFGDALDVHTIDCDARRCRVLVHCVAQFSALKSAFALTIVALIMLVTAIAYTNAPPSLILRHDNLKTL